jgi:hypothetical protein
MSAGEAPRAIPDDPKQTTGSAFGPFRHPAFTVIWTASVVANIGTWMYTAASGWLMTNLDPNALAVSLVQVAASLPIFLIAIPAGALADIVDRRRFLIAGEAANTAIDRFRPPARFGHHGTSEKRPVKFDQTGSE